MTSCDVVYSSLAVVIVGNDVLYYVRFTVFLKLSGKILLEFYETPSIAIYR